MLWHTLAHALIYTLLISAALEGNSPPTPHSGTTHPAQMLFQQLDLERPELAEIKVLVNNRDFQSALELWRDQVVYRLRERDFGEFGWHGYALHPRPTRTVDGLAGIISREEALDQADIPDFIDIFDMSGPPGAGEPINWFVDINGPIEWATPRLDQLGLGQKRLKTDYANFEFFKSFTGRYWQTGDIVYLRKAFEIMSDFARSHRRGFWRDYHEKGIDDTAVRDIYRADWRLNTNGLGMGWRLKNFLKNMAGMAKCLSEDRLDDWEDVLKPVQGQLTQEELEQIPADQLADIALSLMLDHTGKLLWFCIQPGAVPNQRAEGLKALAFLSVIFPNFRQTPQLVEYIERGYAEMLSSNFLPDGGSLEQSFNYNGQDKEGLEELVRFFGAHPPRYAKTALDKVRARRAVDDALQTPLGGMPQVGNSHDVLGKDIWESEDARERYWQSPDIRGRAPIRPQSYASIALPYSGFYAMRGGWKDTDPFLFFMAGRPQRGHSMRDSNAIQMTAYGRQLVVCGGSPTYGNFRTEEARGADFYLSEASSLKNNTVLVDGRSQSKNAPRAARAYRTPVLSQWHTSSQYDLVDGVYDLGYGDFRDRRDVDIDMSVEHYRKVIFVKSSKLWLIEDKMNRTDGQAHDYTQVWNFLPLREDAQWTRSIAGFGEEQFSLDGSAKYFRTTDPDGPNVEFHHFGPHRVSYQKYFGHRDPWLGWFAAGIGDAQPAVDIHVTWHSEDTDSLLTLLIPLDKGQGSPVRQTLAHTRPNGSVHELDLVMTDGSNLSYLSAGEPEQLQHGPVSVQARSLLVHANGTTLSGIVTGCSNMDVNGESVALEAGDFEFLIDADGKITVTPFFIPEVPIIPEPMPFSHIQELPPVAIEGAREGLTIHYTLDGTEPTLESPIYGEPIRLENEAVLKARFFKGNQPLPLVASQLYKAWDWPLRAPDVIDSTQLEQGLRYQVFMFEKSTRLYDLMLRPSDEEGVCADASLEPFKEHRDFGLKFEGYLRIPHDGMYHLYSDSPTQARMFIRDLDRDLPVPPVVASHYNEPQGIGHVALKAGYHRIEIQYMQAWGKSNELLLKIEGPGIDQQPIPDNWFFRM